MTPVAYCSLSRRVMYIVYSLTETTHCLGTLDNFVNFCANFLMSWHFLIIVVFLVKAEVIAW